LEKSAVLQEARQVFNQNAVNQRQSCHVLTKLLYLLNHGEALSTTDATETFFAVTKLFQSSDVRASVRALCCRVC
jgi:coatomer subunit gamma